MIPVLRSLWIWTASATLMLFWMLPVGAVWLFDREPLRKRTARCFRRLGYFLARVNPWRLRITGHENLDRDRVYVIVSNHQSMADIPLIAHLPLDTKWLAKAELFRLPVIGWMLRMAGDVPVARGDRRQGAKAILQCGRILRQGCSVMFFPEGTRSPGGEVLPFSEGPFQLAIREKVDVLPLVVEGSGDALPRSSWIFSETRDIHLRVLEPVAARDHASLGSAALRDKIRGRIVEELHRLRAGA